MGLILAWEVYKFGLMNSRMLNHHLVSPHMTFPYLPGFEVPRATLATWRMVHWIAFTAALGIASGTLYRLSTVVFAAMFIPIFAAESALYLNHLYLVCVLAVFLCFTEGNARWSGDVLLGLRKPSKTIAAYNVLGIRLAMAAVYCYGGIAKVNEDWLLHAVPLRMWLPKRIGMYRHWWAPAAYLFDVMMGSYWVALAMSWIGFLYDLLVPFLFMAGGKLRAFGFLLTMIFHLSNKVIFEIGIFPYLSLALSAVFFEPDWPDQLARWGRGLWRAVVGGGAGQPAKNNKGRSGAASSSKKDAKATTSTGTFQPTLGHHVLTIVLLAFAAHQLLTPLRHWTYPGDVTWNELGHRYSWRMKLRDKAGMVKCAVQVEPGQYGELSTKELLTPNQRRTFAGRPDMIHYFAHRVSQEVAEVEGMDHVPIHCLAIASVNFRIPQYFFDPRVDLASVPLDHWPPPHILDIVPRNATWEHPLVPRNGRNLDDARPDKDRLVRMFDHISVGDAIRHFEDLEAKGIIGPAFDGTKAATTDRPEL
jgi:hypothetical protein